MKKNLGIIFLSTFLLVSCHFFRPELPVMGQLPAFELTDQKAQAVSLEDYRGKIWVANFIFTSCAGTCPMLTQRMKKVQSALKVLNQKQEILPVRIVSFSVDPERDTPEKLAHYAKGHGADPLYWAFLTGPIDKVTETVVQGFKISMGKVPLEGKDEKVGAFDVVHGEKFVLIDEKGQIRGYYSSDSKGIQKLIMDLKYLVKKLS